MLKTPVGSVAAHQSNLRACQPVFILDFFFASPAFFLEQAAKIDRCDRLLSGDSLFAPLLSALHRGRN